MFERRGGGGMIRMSVMRPYWRGGGGAGDDGRWTVCGVCVCVTDTPCPAMSAEVWAAHVRASGVHLPDRIQVSPVHLKVVHRPEGCFMEGLLYDASLYIIQFAKVASLHPYGVVRSRESSPSVKLRSPRGGTPDFGVQVSLVNLT